MMNEKHGRQADCCKKHEGKTEGKEGRKNKIKRWDEALNKEQKLKQKHTQHPCPLLLKDTNS